MERELWGKGYSPALVKTIVGGESFMTGAYEGIRQKPVKTAGKYPKSCSANSEIMDQVAGNSARHYLNSKGITIE